MSKKKDAWTPERKAALSAYQKARWASLTEEQRIAQTEAGLKAMRGVNQKWTPERRAAAAESRKLMWENFTEEERAAIHSKHSESSKKVWSSKTQEERDEWLNKIKESVGSTPEGARRRWSDPEQRRLASERSKAYHARRKQQEKNAQADNT